MVTMPSFRDPHDHIRWALGILLFGPTFGMVGSELGLSERFGVWNAMCCEASLLGCLWFVIAAYRASTPVRGYIWNHGSLEEYACSVCGYRLPENCERCVECGVESPVRRTTYDIHRFALMRFQAIGILFSMAAGFVYALGRALAILLGPEDRLGTLPIESTWSFLFLGWWSVSLLGSMVTVGLAWILPRLGEAIRPGQRP